MMNAILHPLVDVQSKKIGEDTAIWQFCVVLPNAEIGPDCNICSHCFIKNDVVVGDRVTGKCGVQLLDGLRVEDDVFIGPNATLTNDKFPRSKAFPDNFPQTLIRRGASAGGGCGYSAGNNDSRRGDGWRWCRGYQRCGPRVYGRGQPCAAPPECGGLK